MTSYRIPHASHFILYTLYCILYTVYRIPHASHFRVLSAQASPLADGAVNAKFTSSARLAKGQMLFVAGPTHDDQPVFAWSKAPAAVQQTPHVGQPDVWDFGWATYGGGGDDEA